MKKIFIILFLLGAVELHAQLVQVSGYIYARSDSSVSLPNVAIMNKRTKTGTQSSADGFYTVLMAPGDTVEVSLLGYKSVKFGMPANVTISYFHKNVYLKDDYIILKGYTAKDRLTWKKFTEVFTAMAPEKEEKYIMVDKQQLDKSPVNATPHLTLNGPISWLYGKLSRRAKELDKLEELKNGTNPDFVYAQKISDEYVMKATGLPKEQVKPFLEYCNLDNYFYSQATDYDIRAKFSEFLPGFKEHYGEKDSPPVNNTAPSDTVKTTPE
jgi:hypothetical protein